jgi:predicted dehydrogenase
VGYLGRFHAQKFAALPSAELVGVYDADPVRARVVAQEVGTRAVDSLEELLPRVEAVSIAASTAAHHELTRRCLEAGKHVLVEKPIAASAVEAEDLVHLANEKGLVLQVGYLERFNPAFQASLPHVTSPQFIDCVRIASFRERGTDVDVVLDVMSHDLDLVLSLVPSDVRDLHAVGISFMTQQTDLANVRLVFENGCVANLTASRISQKMERKMRLFQRDAYFSLDFAEPSARMLAPRNDDRGGAERSFSVEKGDALLVEIEAFIHAVQTGGKPAVDGAAALRTMKLAERLRADIQANTLP